MIRVSYHAVNQFPGRVFSKSNMNNTEIEKFLAQAALKGNYSHPRPGGAWEVRYDGVSIVVAIKGDVKTVITVLGDRKYRNWSKAKDIRPRYAKCINA